MELVNFWSRRENGQRFPNSLNMHGLLELYVCTTLLIGNERFSFLPDLVVEENHHQWKYAGFTATDFRADISELEIIRTAKWFRTILEVK